MAVGNFKSEVFKYAGAFFGSSAQNLETSSTPLGRNLQAMYEYALNSIASSASIRGTKSSRALDLKSVDHEQLEVICHLPNDYICIYQVIEKQPGCFKRTMPFMHDDRGLVIQYPYISVQAGAHLFCYGSFYREAAYDKSFIMLTALELCYRVAVSEDKAQLVGLAREMKLEEEQRVGKVRGQETIQINSVGNRSYSYGEDVSFSIYGI